MCCSTFIRKVETRPVGEGVSTGLIICAEEDGGCEDSLECLDDSAIVATVLGQMEKVEHLSGALKSNRTAPLLHGEGRYPNWDEPVLAKWDGRFIMHLPQWRLGILCLLGVYLSCARGFGVSVRLTQSA